MLQSKLTRSVELLENEDLMLAVVAIKSDGRRSFCVVSKAAIAVNTKIPAR